MISKLMTLHQARNVVSCGHGKYIRCISWPKDTRSCYVILPNGELGLSELAGESIHRSVPIPRDYPGSDWIVFDTLDAIDEL